MYTLDDNNFNNLYGFNDSDAYDDFDPGYRQRVPRPRPRFPYYFLPFFFIRPYYPPYYPRPYYPYYMLPYDYDDDDYDYDDDYDDD